MGFKFLLNFALSTIQFAYSQAPWDFPGGSDSKASAYDAGDPGSTLGWEDLLEKEMATHSSILVWKIPGMVEPGRLLSVSMGSQESDTT